MLTLKNAKVQDAQKMLVKKLLKAVSKSQKEVRLSNILNEYDRERTLYFLELIKGIEHKSKPSASKTGENKNIVTICYKIIFYYKQYEIYSKYYELFKRLDDTSTGQYNSSLNKLVRHLSKKTETLITELGGKY